MILIFTVTIVLHSLALESTGCIICIILHHIVCFSFLRLIKTHNLKQQKMSNILEQQILSHIHLFGRNSNSIVDGLITFWKMIVVVQKRVIALLFRRLNVDDLIFSTEYYGSNLYGSKPIKSDSLFIKASCSILFLRSFYGLYTRM